MTVLTTLAEDILQQIHEQDPSAASRIQTWYSLQPLSLPLLPTLYMVRRPVLHLMDVSSVCLLLPVLTPCSGRDTHGAVRISLFRMPSSSSPNAQDGISNTFSIIPDALGKDTGVFVGDLDIDALCPKCANIPNTSDNDR